MDKKNVNNGKGTAFHKILASTGQDVLDKRATIIFNSAKAAMDTKLRDLQARKDELELKRINLTDLAIENTDSLRPGSKDFCAADWIEQICSVDYELELLADEIEIASKVNDEFFVEQSSSTEEQA